MTRAPAALAIWMATPRGYANKYSVTGEKSAHAGEKAGKSLSSGLAGWLQALHAAHAAGGTQHQHGLAGLELGPVDQGMP